jgi:hypothetical protein
MSGEFTKLLIKLLMELRSRISFSSGNTLRSRFECLKLGILLKKLITLAQLKES